MSHRGRFRISLRAALIVVALCCVALGALVWSRRQNLSRLYGGRSGLRIVANATRVEAYRLGSLSRDDALDEPWGAPSKYPTADGPVEVPPALAAKAAAALQSSLSYDWLTAKACFPRYGARLSFVRGEEQVDVSFCFECDILAVCREGRFVGAEDFDPARPIFVRTMKACFPDDPVIQSLGDD